VRFAKQEQLKQSKGGSSRCLVPAAAHALRGLASRPKLRDTTRPGCTQSFSAWCPARPAPFTQLLAGPVRALAALGWLPLRSATSQGTRPALDYMKIDLVKYYEASIGCRQEAWSIRSSGGGLN
jgi:hypothetical protein